MDLPTGLDRDLIPCYLEGAQEGAPRKGKTMSLISSSDLPEGWSLKSEADPFAGLICPCGNAIELDGSCPEGCTSPLKGMGLI